jgi:hypothetical protein
MFLVRLPTMRNAPAQQPQGGTLHLPPITVLCRILPPPQLLLFLHQLAIA